MILTIPAFQYERARVIYKYAIDRIDKKLAGDLFKSYTIFEKKFGNRSGIENVIVNKRKFQYEEEVKVRSKLICLTFRLLLFKERCHSNCQS